MVSNNLGVFLGNVLAKSQTNLELFYELMHKELENSLVSANAEFKLFSVVRETEANVSGESKKNRSHQGRRASTWTR